MCISETSDSLDANEQDFLSRAARTHFPSYDFALRSNDDGMTWALLTPAETYGALPKVTICRIDPCIMVMLEDRHARRQFRSLANVEDAVDYAQAMSDGALLAAAGLPEHDPAFH